MNESQSELVVEWYKDLEDRLINILTLVPYSEENKKVILPKLASIIVETGSIIDTVFREEINGNGSKDNLKMKDFNKYYETKYFFSKIRTLLYQYPPRYIVPFEFWSKGIMKNIPWWKNYNELKHNRIQNYNLATLDCAITARRDRFPMSYQSDGTFDPDTLRPSYCEWHSFKGTVDSVSLHHVTYKNLNIINDPSGIPADCNGLIYIYSRQHGFIRVTAYGGFTTNSPDGWEFLPY